MFLPKGDLIGDSYYFPVFIGQPQFKLLILS